MKDGLGAAAVDRIANALAKTTPRFPKARFIAASMDGLEGLELKDRVRHLIGVMNAFLPADFENAAPILVGVKPHWDRGDPDDNLAGFAAWPIIDYIGEHGLAHPETSLAALRELTSMFSAEFAIRPFIIQYPESSLKTLMKWTRDPDEHVRRLVSEGSRPRLPWGQQLPAFIEDPAPVLPLLEALKDDPSEYVRRSVANNLNDISKDHPELVIEMCERWQQGAGADRQWIIKHATRTLVKAGHPEIFGLLGFTKNPQLELAGLNVAPKVIQLGDAIEFSATLRSAAKSTQKIVVDYAIHHRKANGTTTPKVFKFKTLQIAASETVELQKRHAIKPITTRKYYAGEHAVEILINGTTYGHVPFTLEVS